MNESEEKYLSVIVTPQPSIESSKCTSIVQSVTGGCRCAEMRDHIFVVAPVRLVISCDKITMQQYAIVMRNAQPLVAGVAARRSLICHQLII